MASVKAPRAKAPRTAPSRNGHAAAAAKPARAKSAQAKAAKAKAQAKAAQAKAPRRRGPAITLPYRIVETLFHVLGYQERKRFYDAYRDNKDLELPVAELTPALIVQIASHLDTGPDAQALRAALTDRLVALVPETIRTLAELEIALLAEQFRAGDRPALAARLGDRGAWHPMHFTVRLRQSFAGEYLEVRAAYRAGDLTFEAREMVTAAIFVGPAGGAVALSLDEALERLSLRRADAAAVAAAEARTARALALQDRGGTVVAATGPGLAFRKLGWWEQLQPVALGTADRPVQVIVEGELETRQDPYGREASEQTTAAPLVRVFDLGRREYVYVDVDDLAPYEFDAAALDRLVVDPAYRGLLERVFTAGARADVVEDLVQGKHGGIIVLASGPSGTGKTLTAECVAQATGRPLYTIGLADLGTDLDEVQERLEKILVRAARWNALLLIDEADVIMRRRGDDLQRSAIVGLFLHRIEYFRGFLFLTSNLPESLDPAVLSRVTLHQRYPELDAAKRRQVWAGLLAVAGLTAAGDAATLGDLEVDGRRIRAAVRLARLVHGPGAAVPVAELARLARLGLAGADGAAQGG